LLRNGVVDRRFPATYRLDPLLTSCQFHNQQRTGSYVISFDRLEAVAAATNAAAAAAAASVFKATATVTDRCRFVEGLDRFDDAEAAGPSNLIQLLAQAVARACLLLAVSAPAKGQRLERSIHRTLPKLDRMARRYAVHTSTRRAQPRYQLTLSCRLHLGVHLRTM
jgi:hypothetical protein